MRMVRLVRGLEALRMLGGLRCSMGNSMRNAIGVATTPCPAAISRPHNRRRDIAQQCQPVTMLAWALVIRLPRVMP